ncbi:hypothetical protein ACFOLF_11160 [Paenibacillus sepulcri]|uniref:hypothetical protein n=1 Tax=Paenibacillus sepulcri TaxID=359917 RepID=UPI0036060CC7
MIFYQCIHMMLRDNFHKKVAEWCDEFRMEYIAEVPGVRMTTQLYSHIPGGDSAHEKLGKPLSAIMESYAHSLRHNPKMGSSLARQLGRKRALIECFHSIGWTMTLQDARWMIDWMAVMGTNMFNFHAFFYSIDGLRKHDAAPSQFDQNPYWKHFRQLGDYIGRISYIMSEGSAKIDIAVLDPTTSLWTKMGNPFHQFGFAGTDPQDKQRLERMKSDWISIQTALLNNQRDYDTLDPEMLMQAEIADGSLNIGAGRYKALIIPPVSNLEAAAWERIQSFADQGGIVISVGLLPYEQIEAHSVAVEGAAALFHAQAEDPAHYWHGLLPDEASPAAWRKGEKEAYFVPHGPASSNSSRPAGVDGITSLLHLLDQTLPRAVELSSEDGQTGCLLLQHRQLDGQSDIIFIANHEGLEKKVYIRLSESHFGSRPKWLYRNLETGEIRPLSSESGDGGSMALLTFAPYQSHLIEIVRVQDETAAKPVGHPGIISQLDGGQQTAPHIQVEADTDWEFELAQPNLLRLGQLQMSLDMKDEGLEQGWQLNHSSLPGAEWLDVETKPWINQCADHKEVLRHALGFNSRSFGTPYQVTVAYPVVCWYRIIFDADRIPEWCELTMDREAIAGEYRLFVNGIEWDGGQPELINGTNTIMIRMVIRHAHDGVVDPLYLRGMFGVRFTAEQRPVITDLPLAGNPNRPVPDGSPYYSGTLVFRRRIAVQDEAARSETFELSFTGLSEHFHDCAEVILNGHSLGVRPWTPYVWKGSGQWWKPGENLLELRVDNALGLRLDGSYFDYDSHQVKESARFGSEVNPKEAQQ